MIRAQAELITKLRTQLDIAIRDRVASEQRVEAMADAAHYYMQIQRACAEHPMVLSEWQRFCAVLALAADGESTPAITALTEA